MTADHCPGCPFLGCPSCRYQGAEPFAAQANPGARRWPEGGISGKVGHSKTAPAGNRGLSPTEAAKPHGRTCTNGATDIAP